MSQEMFADLCRVLSRNYDDLVDPNAPLQVDQFLKKYPDPLKLPEGFGDNAPFMKMLTKVAAWSFRSDGWGRLIRYTDERLRSLLAYNERCVELAEDGRGRWREGHRRTYLSHAYSHLGDCYLMCADGRRGAERIQFMERALAAESKGFKLADGHDEVYAAGMLMERAACRLLLRGELASGEKAQMLWLAARDDLLESAIRLLKFKGMKVAGQMRYAGSRLIECARSAGDEKESSYLIRDGAICMDRAATLWEHKNPTNAAFSWERAGRVTARLWYKHQDLNDLRDARRYFGAALRMFGMTAGDGESARQLNTKRAYRSLLSQRSVRRERSEEEEQKLQPTEFQGRHLEDFVDQE